MFYSVPKTGTGFLVPVFGTGFWCVCRWLKVTAGRGLGKNGPDKNGPGKNGPEKTVRGIIGLVVESVKTVRSFR